MPGEEIFEKGRFEPPSEFKEKAIVKSESIYEEAERDLEGFWAKAADELHWFKKWDRVLERNHPFYRWFVGGKINASYNCLDRHLDTWRKNKAAIIWEGEPGDSKTYTYQQLHHEVSKFANVLKSLGVKKGDRVTIYLPMIPELPIAMLACARIGAIHSVVFGGFSAQALQDRINDAEAKVLITADGGYRRGKIVPLKKNSDEALENAPSIEHVVVVKRTGEDVPMKEGRDLWWHDLMKNASHVCEAEPMDSTDPLFILYTSGTTGKPKGVVHLTGGYIVGTYLTSKYVFDLKDEDIYWCTADIGWITGHSYIVYGPLANGATVVMYEGAPDYPQYDRFWEIVEKYGVTILYTAPTAIRAFIKWGEEWPKKHDLSSLRLLGTVGEPINPDVWLWYYRVIGNEKCPIVDTWWQTETGMILITPLPGISVLKPGSAYRPFPGIKAEVVDDDGNPVPRGQAGNLVIKSPWPAMLGTLYKDPERYKRQYWSQVEGAYFTGDGARIDEDGYFWLLGRIDDVINVSGHRLGTMEVESALVSHEAVAEAAVVGIPHEIKGQGIAAYVVLKEEFKPSDDLTKDLKMHVRKVIGPIATPDEIHYVDKLPKTRSGKIMRRIMRAIKTGKDIGDVSTLEEEAAIKEVREK
ncbi:MAG: acetate--CoA ligase [Thermoplasmata archaeon]|nr:MAG: acetate--CoA ligase [Thermoplasmata archaeon]